MNTEEYVDLMRDVFSRDPNRVRDANRRLFAALVQADTSATSASSATMQDRSTREADLVLAQIAH